MKTTNNCLIAFSIFGAVLCYSCNKTEELQPEAVSNASTNRVVADMKIPEIIAVENLLEEPGTGTSTCNPNTGLANNMISWKSDSSAELYVVYRNSEPVRSIVNKSSNKTYYYMDDNKMSEGKGVAVSYQVRASNSRNPSVGSNGLILKIKNCPQPIPAFLLNLYSSNINPVTKTSTCDSKAKVSQNVFSWKGNINATRYMVYRKGVLVASIANNNATTHYYIDPKIEAKNTSIIYKVEASNSQYSTSSTISIKYKTCSL